MPIRRAGDTSFRIRFFFGTDKNNILQRKLRDGLTQ